MLPQMSLHLEERHAILMHVDCAHDDLRLMPHPLKSINFHELPLAFRAKKTLFCSYIPLSFAVLDNIR